MGETVLKSGTRRTVTGRRPANPQVVTDYAVDGVRRVLPTARVGGPDPRHRRQNRTRDFRTPSARHQLRHRQDRHAGLTSWVFHAKGSPTYTNDHVRIIAAQPAPSTKVSRYGLRIPESVPPHRHRRGDPGSCCARGDQMGYRNGTDGYSSYTAAFRRFQENRRPARRESRCCIDVAFTLRGLSTGLLVSASLPAAASTIPC